jgi:hypothetical protein
MKKYVGLDVWSNVFLGSSLVEGELLTPRPYSFTLGEKAPGTHYIGAWMGHRAGMGDMEKCKFLTLPGLELEPIGRPASSRPIYRLRYPGYIL